MTLRASKCQHQNHAAVLERLTGSDHEQAFLLQNKGKAFQAADIVAAVEALRPFTETTKKHFTNCSVLLV